MSRLRHKSTDSQQSSKPGDHGRASAHQVYLSNPDYLLEGSVERHCHLIGVIDDLPSQYNIESRIDILNKLDEKRSAGVFKWHVGQGEIVIISISAYNLKISEPIDYHTLHRIPLHEIASLSYVRDDDEHLLFIKAGSPRQPLCPVYVFICAKQSDAEDIISILQQAFDLIYTQQTMEHFNESINMGLVYHSTPTQSPNRTLTMKSTRSIPNTTTPTSDRIDDASLYNTPKRVQTPKIEVSVECYSEYDYDEMPDGDLEPVDSNEHMAEQLVQGYMNNLHDLLKFEELQIFAKLLKNYREGLAVKEFCNSLSNLYGRQRDFLLPGMRAFIPEEDRAIFEAFLVDHNTPGNNLMSVTKSTPIPPLVQAPPHVPQAPPPPVPQAPPSPPPVPQVPPPPPPVPQAPPPPPPVPQAPPPPPPVPQAPPPPPPPPVPQTPPPPVPQGPPPPPPVPQGPPPPLPPIPHIPPIHASQRDNYLKDIDDTMDSLISGNELSFI